MLEPGWLSESNNYSYVQNDHISDEDKIYHYTSNIDALEGIVDGKLWATDLNYFRTSKNEDNMEGRLILTQLKDYLEKFSNTSYAEGMHSILNSEEVNILLSRIDVYAASLSFQGLSKYLWDNYSNSDGFIIEFNKKKFLDTLKIFTPSGERNDKQIFKHAKIIYDEEKQKAIMQEAILKLLELLKKDICLVDKDKIWIALKKVMFLGMYYKQSAYSAEKEYRIIVETLSHTNERLKDALPVRESTSKPHIVLGFNTDAITQVACTSAQYSRLKETLPDYINLVKINEQELS